MADLTLKSKVASPTIDYGGAVVLEEWPFLMWGLDWVISCPIDTFLSTYYTTGMKQTMLLLNCVLSFPMSFVASWNNFIWPFIVITGTDMMTIPVGLANVQSAYGIHYAQIMASALLGGLPLLIVFMFFQKQIVQGIAGTGLKG